MDEKRTRSLPVKLNNEELMAKGQELAAKAGEISEAKDDLKSVGKTMKDQIALMEKELDVLVRIVRQKMEYREVECVEVRDNIRMVIQIWRCDTNEIVETRPMTQVERQLSMFPDRLRVVDSKAETETTKPAEDTVNEQGGETAAVESTEETPAESSEAGQ